MVKYLYFFNMINIFSHKKIFLIANNNLLNLMSDFLNINNSSLENLINNIFNIANSPSNNRENSSNNNGEFVESEDENDYTTLIDRLDKIHKTMDSISIAISKEN